GALDVVWPFALVGTTAPHTWAIPNQPAAAGLVVTTQTGVLGPAVNAAGVLVSNALALTLGVH
ncbi:MAG: hypothetical protein JNK15_23805, partial [Planctomycetes bacterium]|nr:hypothetical protein [Planctomycetota bacterium]